MRKSLLATDVSGEAQPALEWTIGMVLREGFILMAIYAINQDMVEDGGKIVPDHRIAGELSSHAAMNPRFGGSVGHTLFESILSLYPSRFQDQHPFKIL